MKEPQDISQYPWIGRKLMFLDKSRNVDRVAYTVYAVCAVLFLADFFYKKKSYLAAEDIPGFYAIYGFVMCALLVITAKMMRRVLKRSEDYYAPHDVEAEEHPEEDLERENVHD